LLSAQLIGSYDADSLILISKAVSTTNSFSGNDTETINDVEHDAKQALSFWHTKKRKKKKNKTNEKPKKIYLPPFLIPRKQQTKHSARNIFPASVGSYDCQKM